MEVLYRSCCGLDVHALNGRTRKGNQALRKGLVQAAHAAAHTKNTFLAAQYQRLARRRGRKRAVLAVAHSILVIAYHCKVSATRRDIGIEV